MSAYPPPRHEGFTHEDLMRSFETLQLALMPDGDPDIIRHQSYKADIELVKAAHRLNYLNKDNPKVIRVMEAIERS